MGRAPVRPSPAQRERALARSALTMPTKPQDPSQAIPCQDKKFPLDLYGQDGAGTPGHLRSTTARWTMPHSLSRNLSFTAGIDRPATPSKIHSTHPMETASITKPSRPRCRQTPSSATAQEPALATLALHPHGQPAPYNFHSSGLRLLSTTRPTSPVISA